MDNNELYHHGVLGMKWGVRRYQNKDGTLTKDGQSRFLSGDKTKTPKTDGKKKVSSGHKKDIKDMTDAEIREKINRLELEQKYRNIVAKENQARISKGRDFVISVLKKSGDNIATQLTTYAMGTAINKLVGSDIVNPKKGQKDK